MSENLITSHPIALAYLMNEDIYEVNETQPEKKHEEPTKNKILVLFHEYVAKDLPIVDKEFLLKVLKAVNLSEKDIIIVNRAHATERTEELIEKNQAKIVLAFGVNELIEGSNSNLYTISKIGNTEWLSAEELSVIGTDMNRKKQLWTSLKKIFHVN